jgi:hypothetical protein
VVADGSGIAHIACGATASNFTIIHNNTVYFETSSGSIDVGFRCRARVTSITASDMRFGLWDDSTFNPDNDNALNGFKIVNGVVSVVWFDSVLHVVSTGVTVTTGDQRWYSYYFDPVNGILQWHISAAGGSIQNGYTGGTYGEQSAGDVGAGNAMQVFAGVKTTAAGAKALRVDYLAAWSSSRQFL